MSELISASEFARRSSCDEKQVRRALAKGYLTRGKDGLLDASQLQKRWRRTTRRAAEVSGKVSGHSAEVSGNRREVSGRTSDVSDDAGADERRRIYGVGWLDAAVDLAADVPMLAAEAVLDCGGDQAVAEAVFGRMVIEVTKRLGELAEAAEVEPEPDFETLASYWPPEAFNQPRWGEPRPWPRTAVEAD